MKLLAFHTKADPRVEVRLSDALRAENFPEWAAAAGYAPVGFRVPKPGDYFYAPIRDKVLRCNAEETRAFVIVEWNGGNDGTD